MSKQKNYVKNWQMKKQNNKNWIGSKFQDNDCEEKSSCDKLKIVSGGNGKKLRKKIYRRI